MQDRRHPRASGERRPRCLRGSPQGSAASGLLRCRAGRRVPASAPAPGCHRPFDIRDLVSTRFTADTRGPPPIACTCASRQTALTVLAGCSPASRRPGRWAGRAVRCRDCAPGESRERHRFASSCPIPPSARAVPTGFRRRTAIRGSSPCRRVASSGAAWGGRFCVTQIDPPRGPPSPVQSSGKPWSPCAGIAAGKDPGSLPPPREFAGTNAGTNAGAKTTE